MSDTDDHRSWSSRRSSRSSSRTDFFDHADTIEREAVHLSNGTLVDLDLDPSLLLPTPPRLNSRPTRDLHHASFTIAEPSNVVTASRPSLLPRVDDGHATVPSIASLQDALADLFVLATVNARSISDLQQQLHRALTAEAGLTSVKSHNSFSRSVIVTNSHAERYDYRLASQKYLEDVVSSYPLPRANDQGTYNRLAHDFFSAYRILCGLALVTNMILFFWACVGAGRQNATFSAGDASTAVAANLCCATLMRHEHCINALFRICTSRIMRHSPLSVRRRAAKVYSYGGLHSGCGISAFFWYILFAVLLLQNETGRAAPSDYLLRAISHALIALTSLMLVLFIAIISLAHPSLRARYHNQWELVHRYAGWSAIGVIWAQTILVPLAQAREQAAVSFIHLLLTTPSFWLLLVISVLFVYPWLRVRRRAVEAEPLSDHAIRLHFRSKNALPTCVGTRLSSNPFSENHGFATIPNPDGRPGFSVLVSNAGDWTSRVIKNPPKHFYTRGAFTVGVLRVALLFKPVVIVATGSGIGPCLSFLQVHPGWPVRILWSTRDPERTYGKEILDTVWSADPRAVIVDAKRFSSGYRPDLPRLAYGLYKESRAEAVVIISNPRVTRNVVGTLEKRGVPAFGAIFDS